MIVKLNRLAVFCGAFSGNRPEYLKAADDLANVLVSANIELVYGGGNAGMMGQLATEMLRLGGKVIGVMPSFLVEKEVAKSNLTELHVVDSMHERKLKLATMADGFVMLPGGVGTLDEFFEVATLVQTEKFKQMPKWLLERITRSLCPACVSRMPWANLMDAGIPVRCISWIASILYVLMYWIIVGFCACIALFNNNITHTSNVAFRVIEFRFIFS